jgi:hypothetical protein
MADGWRFSVLLELLVQLRQLADKSHRGFGLG